MVTCFSHSLSPSGWHTHTKRQTEYVKIVIKHRFILCDVFNLSSVHAAYSSLENELRPLIFPYVNHSLAPSNSSFSAPFSTFFCLSLHLFHFSSCLYKYPFPPLYPSTCTLQPLSAFCYSLYSGHCLLASPILQTLG